MTLTTWMQRHFEAVGGQKISDVVWLAREDGLRVKSETEMGLAFLREHARREGLRRRLKARAVA